MAQMHSVTKRKEIIMKYKKLICILLTAVLLGGCIKEKPKKPAEENPDITITATPTNTVTPADDSEKDPLKEALAAYRDILKAAPAIEGDCPDLSDASFDYEENLSMFGNHFDRFLIYDINQDGIPELIAESVVNFRWKPISVFTYADGKAVLLKDPLSPESHGTFEQRSTASGSYEIYLCGKHHIHSVWKGETVMGIMEENASYAIEGTEVIPAECDESEYDVVFSDVALKNTGENVEAAFQNYQKQ